MGYKRLLQQNARYLATGSHRALRKCGAFAKCCELTTGLLELFVKEIQLFVRDSNEPDKVVNTPLNPGIGVLGLSLGFDYVFCMLKLQLHYLPLDFSSLSFDLIDSFSVAVVCHADSLRWKFQMCQFS